MEGIIIVFIVIIISILLHYYLNKEQNNKKNKLCPLKILDEEDHVTCFLIFPYNKKNYFLSGQMNGMISFYNGETYKPTILIFEHCEPITSLSNLNDNRILSSSADGTMKKIKILNENRNSKNYLVEFVFYTNKEFIFKSIQINSLDDIISCNISKELILWKKNKNNDNPLYKVEKILINDEYVRDIFQINENIFISTGETLQCWDINNGYKNIKKLLYICKGNNCIYKINKEFTGILMQNDGNILLFDNNELNGVKIIKLSNYTLTCLKSFNNNILLIGFFDINYKKSFINEYIFDGMELKLNKENIYNDNCSKPNWHRINLIDEFDNNIILGIGGEENLRNFGKLMIFYRN